MGAAPAVSVHNLTKDYGAFQAVKGLDFEIHVGEVFGLLGPNGAGKTTTVEILEGLRTRSGGDVSVLGVGDQHPHDPQSRMTRYFFWSADAGIRSLTRVPRSGRDSI